MDERRVGRALKVIRRARHLGQADVAAAAGVSRATVSSIEVGRWRAMPLRMLAAVFHAVKADVDIVVRYRGAELDRLLDAGHAATVAALAAQLRAVGWLVELEASFNHYGDRGSIDVLAYHPSTRTLLVAEVKTVIASAEETLRRLDVKVRVAPQLAPGRFGEKPLRVVRLLAVTASSTNRARVEGLEPHMVAFPLRGRPLAAWLRSPGPIPGGRPGGLLFVRNAARDGVTKRVLRVRRSAGARERPNEHEETPGTRAGGGQPGVSRP
jgi:transcriptional regulator with XRE-family HTH domain